MHVREASLTPAQYPSGMMVPLLIFIGSDTEGWGHLGFHALGLRLRLSCLNCFVDGDGPHGVHAVVHAGRQRGDLRVLRGHPRPALHLHASRRVMPAL